MKDDYFQYHDGFCHTSVWIATGIHVPTPAPSWTHSIPLGGPRAPALGALLHASTLHWSSLLHVVMYIFQCYSLKSSRPRLLEFRARSPLPTKREKKRLTSLIPFPRHCLHIRLTKGHRVPTCWVPGSAPCPEFQIWLWHAGPTLRSLQSLVTQGCCDTESWLSYKQEMHMCQWCYISH